MMRRIPFLSAALVLSLGASAWVVDAQAPQGAVAAAPMSTAVSSSKAIPTAAPVSPDYVIGADDVLSILFWRDKDLSTEVTVRPDGKITLPLLNDVQAAGRTPEELGDAVREAARKFVEDPNPTVIVKEIKSRRVFITGRIEKPGPYPLNGKTTILQLIAMAGGLREFVDGKDISLMRSEKDKQSVFAFNYQDVVKKRYLHQNIELKPGDVVVVP
jgi:polysaccharide export outer membrane protein